MLTWIITRLSETSSRIALATFLGDLAAQLKLVGHIDLPSTAATALVALAVAITPDNKPNPPSAGPSA